MNTILHCIVPKVSATSLALSAMFALLLCGCNTDAFVNPIRPSATYFSVAEDGDSVKVRFKTDDWRVHSVRVNGGSSWSPDFSSEIIETVDGKIRLTANGFTMFYKKSSERELAMFFQPNFSDSDLKVDVVVASSFEYDTLTVTQPRSSGYELESMEWNGIVKRTLPEFEKGWGPTSFKNPGPDTLYVPCEVFPNAERKVSFTDDMEFGHFCGDFMVPVPDRALNHGELAFNDKERIKYSYETERYPLDDDSKVVMRFPPTNEFSWYYGMLWYVDTYETDYTMVLRNKGTGKLVKVDGTFTSEAPNGEYTFYVDKK